MSLDARRIASLLATERFGRSLDVRERTGSTNDDARDATDAPDGHVVLADAQDAGRGARGRSWASPGGTDLYFSIVVRRPGIELARLPPLTLAVGLGVARACQAHTRAELSLKWPNDVVHADAKLAGILVESVSIGATLERVVIGVGVDVNRTDFGDLAPIATSLRGITGEPLDRERVFADALLGIESEVDRFLAHGSAAIVPRVEARLAWKGREVDCDGARGVLLGLREDGALRLATPTGERPIVSGTLRLQ
ncbi:MAG: biotin--[acetyl-CoA-carboxylase] ligase [Sandaracinaceae bacterium]|nr:biotin--[acetyl-CoA-carboxylase] ligase [Sandaracinaceae bacterium]